MNSLSLSNCKTTLAALLVCIALSGCSRSSFSILKPGSLFSKSSISDLAANIDPEDGFKDSGEWFESYELAHREALRTDKPMMVAFSGRQWCGPCIELRKKVFETSEFARWAADNVVLLELDFPRGNQTPGPHASQNRKLAQQYSVTSYPTVLILDADGMVKGKLGHGTSAGQWIKRAQSMIGN